MQPQRRPSEIKAPDAWNTDITRHDDGGYTVVQRPIVVDPVALREKEKNAAEIAAWDAEWKRVRRQVGHEACYRAGTRIGRRLEKATITLTPMEPKTMAGLAAKARSAKALDPHEDFALNDWGHGLMVAVLRDAVRIGGAA